MCQFGFKLTWKRLLLWWLQLRVEDRQFTQYVQSGLACSTNRLFYRHDFRNLDLTGVFQTSHFAIESIRCNERHIGMPILRWARNLTARFLSGQRNGIEWSNPTMSDKWTLEQYCTIHHREVVYTVNSINRKLKILFCGCTLPLLYLKATLCYFMLCYGISIKPFKFECAPR